MNNAQGQNEPGKSSLLVVGSDAENMNSNITGGPLDVRLSLETHKLHFREECRSEKFLNTH